MDPVSVHDAPAPAVPDHRSPFARAHDAVHLVFLCAFATLGWTALARGGEGGLAGAITFTVLLGAVAVLVARMQSCAGGRTAGLIHGAYGLLVLPTVFDGVRHLVPSLPPSRWDATLAAFDRDRLGIDIPRWSEGILTPGLADVMMVFYALYFLMPVVLLAGIALRGTRRDLYRAAFTISLALYVTYLVYMLVPAAGPRFAHPLGPMSDPLPRGVLTGRLHDFIRDLEPQPWDAFPSAHVVLGLLCSVLAWPLRGTLRWGMLVTGVGTVVSTVVLRYHWLVDDLAGLVVITLALGAAWALDRRARRRAEGGSPRMKALLAPAEGTP